MPIPGDRGGICQPSSSEADYTARSDELAPRICLTQSTGDGIFALFGAPVAHEDHPQRALYAALRMQEEIRRYGDRLLEGGGVPLEIRVGATTGEVVVRSIETGEGHVEYTPIGHTTNLASRMQAVAFWFCGRKRADTQAG